MSEGTPKLIKVINPRGRLVSFVQDLNDFTLSGLNRKIGLDESLEKKLERDIEADRIRLKAERKAQKKTK